MGPVIRKSAGSLLFVAIVFPRPSHAFTHTALSDKFRGQLFQLQSQQIGALIYKADHDVGASTVAAVFQVGAVCLVALAFGAGEIADRQRRSGFLVPQLQAVNPQIIAVVFQQHTRWTDGTVPPRKAQGREPSQQGHGHTKLHTDSILNLFKCLSWRDY